MNGAFRHKRAGRSTRRSALSLAAVVLVVAPSLAACGLPDESRKQTIDDSSVPYELLGTIDSSPDDQTETSTTPQDAPVVFWLRSDELLAPSATELRCDQPTAEVVQRLLDTLDSPSKPERDAGLSSAVPPTAQLSLVEVEGGIAEVELDPVAIGDAERLPLAVGQVVLSVTSAPGVEAVELTTSGQAVDVPLPGGALATGPVGPRDYASLLPARLAAEVAGSIGCPAP